MAEIDFSNAKLEPYLHNPMSLDLYVGLYRITNSSGQSIAGSSAGTAQYIADTSGAYTTMIVIISGTMSASGTEFYMATAESTGNIGWRVSNISFQSGDTFYLQIQCKIVTN